MINAAVNAQQSSCVGQPMNNQMDILIRGLIAGAAVVGLIVALVRALVTGVINGIDGGPVSRSTEAGAFWTTFLLATLALTVFIGMLVL